jgi:hypothetical protein
MTPPEIITVRCWSCRNFVFIPLESARTSVLHPCECGRLTYLGVKPEGVLSMDRIDHDSDTPNSGATHG